MIHPSDIAIYMQRHPYHKRANMALDITISDVIFLWTSVDTDKHPKANVNKRKEMVF